MQRILTGALAALVALTVSSCSFGSPEDKMTAFLADTICLADQAYKAISDPRVTSSGMTIAERLKSVGDINKRLEDLKTANFGSATQLEDVKSKIKDKKAVAERAISEAKKKCSPSENSIEQITRDFQ